MKPFISPTLTVITLFISAILAFDQNPQIAHNFVPAGGNDTCSGEGGNWSAPGTWLDNSVPTGADNVTIGNGCAVTIDGAAVALGVTVQSGGVLQFDAAAARSLAAAQSVTIDAGGTLRSASSGTVTAHLLTVGTDLTNNGVLDLSTNGDTAGAELRFTGAANNSFTGSGATTDLRLLTVNKGMGAVTPASPTLDVELSNMSVRGASAAAAGFINTTLFNGIIKFSGTNTFSSVLFTSAVYSIPSTAGIRLDNPNFTVLGQNGSSTLSGLLRVTRGTYNIGTSTGNSMGFAAGSRITVEGGAINAAGRFGVSIATNAVTYDQSGGTITVQAIGNTSGVLAGFDLGTNTSSVVNISGGTIICQTANTAASTPRDYRHQAGAGLTSVSGGTLQLGNAASGAAKAFNITGVVPNLVIDNASAGHSAVFLSPVNFNNSTLDITIDPGATLSTGNILLFNGLTVTNNGTLAANLPGSRFVAFRPGGSAIYQGTGVSAGVMTNFEIRTDNFTFDPGVNNIVVRRIVLLVGNIINADKLTLGNNDAVVSEVQIGSAATPTAAGTFDAAPVFDLGTGGQTISYLRTGASRSTGPEINPGRTLVSLTYDDNDPAHTLTIAGGDLTVTGTLSLTNGVILTGPNTLINNGTAARTNGYVDGSMGRTYGLIGLHTFHVGQNGYSPVAVNVTSGTFPATMTVRAFDSTLVGFSPARSISRNWHL